MLFDPRWAKPLALALSLPSLILGAAYGAAQLVKWQILPRWLAILLFFLVVGNSLFLMVYYGFKNRN